MKKIAFLLALSVAVVGCGKGSTPKLSTGSAPATAASAAASGPFTHGELQEFAALDPVDTHTHVFQSNPAFYAFLKKLNLHILDIMLVTDTDAELENLSKESADTWRVVHGSDGRVALCTTIDPFRFKQRDFAQESIRKINNDFAHGAVAVKIWKNIGMEIKDAKGNYLMADNPVFEPIFKDIDAHHKTLIAHLADPDSAFAAPNRAAPDYEYLMQHPKLYMYGKPGAPAKADIIRARDHILDRNPNLRLVGAHLGSMEGNFNELGQHLDQYPNLAVDLAGRMPYFEMQSRDKMIAFITKYQDRLIYATDNEFSPDGSETLQDWENGYANDWRYFATDETVLYRDQKVRGLNLPPSILRKLYHDNAVKWFPGILGSSH